MRDFIPAGEDLDGAERQHADNMRKLWQNGVYQDFIPGEPTPEPVRLDRRGHTEQTRARRIERMATAVQDEFAAAKRRLQNLTPAQAIEFIGGLPPKRMEMFLLAEEAIGGRESVLSRFPAVSPAARELFGVLEEVVNEELPVAPQETAPEAGAADSVTEATESDRKADEPEVEE